MSVLRPLGFVAKDAPDMPWKHGLRPITIFETTTANKNHGEKHTTSIINHPIIRIFI
jgi:hypothetical protein